MIIYSMPCYSYGSLVSPVFFFFLWMIIFEIVEVKAFDYGTAYGSLALVALRYLYAA